MYPRRLEISICLALLIGILAVYGQVWNHGFLYYDDGDYVTRNQLVREGLTSQNISRAFTATAAANWHPLTWLSHMADCHFFGLNPGPHHLTSLLFHIVNTLLLFAVFRMMTGRVWQSAFVAALFAFHPLHVESVAWLAERKDVLSAFFWLLTMWAYVRYTRRPGIVTYLMVFLFFSLGLMSKPMVVTLPFVLILLDIWPLGRLRWGEDRGQWFRSVCEKVPLFLLSAASSVVTFLVQRGGGAVSSLDAIPLEARVANALISYISYLMKAFWPHKLTVFYPYPGAVSLMQGLMAAAVILFITVLVMRAIKKHPCLAVGWLWYLGTLVPVIGLVQVGSQSMADRYTYLPLVGIFVMVSWGIPALLSRWRFPRGVLAVAASSVLAVLMAVTWVQAGYWKGNISLFRHALDVTTGNSLAHNNLGTALHERGDTQQAAAQYREALRIRPAYPEALVNLGNALALQGKKKEAIDQYREAIRIRPVYPEALVNLGTALAEQGEAEQAIEQYREALRLNPDIPLAHYGLAFLLDKRGELVEAVTEYAEAVRIDPGNAQAHFRLGVGLLRQGRPEEAIGHYAEAMRLDAHYKAVASYNIACAYALQGKVEEAVGSLREAVEAGYNNWNLIRTDPELENIRGSVFYREVLRNR